MKNNDEKPSQLLKHYVDFQINTWKTTKDLGKTKAELAQLRKDVGKSFEGAQGSWPIILNSMPDKFFNSSEYIKPAKKEVIASYYAFTLFAFHYQGWNITETLEEQIPKFGQALYLLTQGDDEEEIRIMRRIKMLISQKNAKGIYEKIRPIIQLLKSEHIELDYGNLACDFYFCMQDNEIDKISYKWMKDYYSEKAKKRENKNGK
ncbi:hypothetical protein C815_00997 [Firmicutes bacterium M10-2]|nr:hypothetical protein C815_00997 [Firmicutes bacterium M10-2]